SPTPRFMPKHNSHASSFNKHPSSVSWTASGFSGSPVSLVPPSSSSPAKFLPPKARPGPTKRPGRKLIAVSNIHMTRSSRWFAITSLFLLSSLVLANGTRGQASGTPETQRALYFWARSQPQLFAQGEPVILVLSIGLQNQFL